MAAAEITLAQSTTMSNSCRVGEMLLTSLPPRALIARPPGADDEPLAHLVRMWGRSQDVGQAQRLEGRDRQTLAHSLSALKRQFEAWTSMFWWSSSPLLLIRGFLRCVFSIKIHSAAKLVQPLPQGDLPLWFSAWEVERAVVRCSLSGGTR